MQNYHDNSIRLEHSLKDAIKRFVENDLAKFDVLQLARADFFDMNSITQIILILEIINSSIKDSMEPTSRNRFNSFRNYLHEIQISVERDSENLQNYPVGLIGESKYQEIVDECVEILRDIQLIRV